MKKAIIQLETLTCPSCIQKIEGSLKKVNGVDKESINVRFNASKTVVNFDEEKVSIEQIEEAITKMGYPILSSKEK